jgi:ubiquitin carboxyl-terminal hydrolase 34
MHSRFFGDFLRRNDKSRIAFSDMICQFARLTGKFVAMDVQTLTTYARNGNNEHRPDLASRAYISAFGFLLRKDESSHIGRNLETHYSWDWDEDIAAMSDSFQTAGGDIPTMTSLVEGKLKIMSSEPKLIEDLTEPCKIVVRFVTEAAASLEGSDIPHQRTLDDVCQKVLEGYEFFKILSAGLEVIIDKHLTFLSADSAMTYLNGLTELYRRKLLIDDSVSQNIIATHDGDLSRLHSKHLPRAISLEWKFSVLKKLITSTQMQLRVVGVTTMCADLLQIFNSGNLKGSDPATSPFLLYFSDFLLQNQLVDYLVGIGSHPEIINESNNILGFLIVTKTYKQTQTDKIWQTVMTSQDPRVVEAILKMVGRCLNLYDYRSLTYLCKKAIDVPIELFSMVMREFCSSLFENLRNKAGSEGAAYVGPTPYNLLVRLIKESSVASSDASARYPEIHAFATTRFRDLLPHGPGPESRNSIYLNCIQDIAAKTPAAAGSICIINILLKQNMMTDLKVLTIKHGLTQLLVDELESAVATGSESSNQTMKNSPANQARRELLLGIIVHEPGTISPELGQRLWDVLVGSKSKSVMERNVSWHILNGAVKKTSSNNVFLATCFKEYLPKLPTHCLTQGALEFAKEAVVSWLDEVRPDFVENDRSFDSQALEQIWHMILTAPPNTIDATAISMLVDVFVNSPLILSISRIKARTIHLALVDRCLQQLKGAAAKLKDFSGDLASGSDEAMVIVASEDQFQEQEKIFARSLAVLREFLRAYQSKPQFAPPKSRTPITSATSVVEGEPLTVKYQSFDGDTHTEVKSLTLGKLNTAASLFATLQKATGFKNYKVYCSGKEFDPDEVDVCKSLDDLKLNGLVLVQRREEADTLPAHLSGNKPTLEAEITKHFDDLWSYLSMHEKVAQEVSIYYGFKKK